MAFSRKFFDRRRSSAIDPENRNSIASQNDNSKQNQYQIDNQPVRKPSFVETWINIGSKQALAQNTQHDENEFVFAPAGLLEWEWAGQGTIEILESGESNYVEQFIDGKNSTSNRRSITMAQSPNLNGKDTLKVVKEEKKLGQIMATAISGNDITSSVLYTLGVVGSYAGALAPICLFLVVLVLYLFRKIYVEVVTAFPINGGTYTAILNTCQKPLAIIAGCLSFLSYTATVVVSATNSMQYLQSWWAAMPILPATIIIMAVFCGITLCGVKDSAPLAAFIFTCHLSTLTILAITAVIAAFKNHWFFLADNYRHDMPSNIGAGLVFGYASAMLGISGFETSSNFIEQQKKGVFRKTLRNMWILVAIINPAMSILSFAVVPRSVLYQNGTFTTQASTALLSVMAVQIENTLNLKYQWLSRLVIVNAVVVLCGAVFTGYVGVTGLLTRMSLDGCIPTFLASKLPFVNTPYMLIVGFFLICTTLYLISGGNLLAIGGTYTIAFLSVMILFGLANIFLKYSRNSIKREQVQNGFLTTVALLFIILAWVTNVVMDVTILFYFFIYFAGFGVLAWLMFNRINIISGILHKIENKATEYSSYAWLRKHLINTLKLIQSEPMIFFTKRGDMSTMNQALQYVESNEHTRIVKIVHVYNDKKDIPPKLMRRIRLLDKCYPKLRLDVILIQGIFNPEMIAKICEHCKTQPNKCLIACPSSNFAYDIAQLGGVRIITERVDIHYRELVTLWKDKLAKVTVPEGVNNESLNNMAINNTNAQPQ